MVFTQTLADVYSLEFEWQQDPQVSRTLLSILADLSKAVVWMVSTCPQISSHPFINHLGIVPSAPATTGITVIFVFHSFFIIIIIIYKNNMVTQKLLTLLFQEIRPESLYNENNI